MFARVTFLFRYISVVVQRFYSILLHDRFVDDDRPEFSAHKRTSTARLVIFLTTTPPFPPVIKHTVKYTYKVYVLQILNLVFSRHADRLSQVRTQFRHFRAVFCDVRAINVCFRRLLVVIKIHVFSWKLQSIWQRTNPPAVPDFNCFCFFFQPSTSLLLRAKILLPLLLLIIIPISLRPEVSPLHAWFRMHI